jgi:hypothetical protein
MPGSFTQAAGRRPSLVAVIATEPKWSPRAMISAFIRRRKTMAPGRDAEKTSRHADVV